MTNNSQENQGNLYLASLLAIVFMLVAAAGVWATQVRSSSAARPVAAEAAEGEPVSVEAAPAQATTGDAVAGQEFYTTTCSACHGPTGEGIPGLGKDMTASEFIAGKTDQELVEFIKVGRDPGDPLNTTGIGMPARGGNPALSDEDLYHIVTYIRTIQK